MGIPHLTTFVNKNSRSLREYVDMKNAAVVIDGHSFFKTLLHYTTSFHYGGNYIDMYKMFFDTVNGIQECNVQMFVIFDGGFDFEKKLATWLTRRNNEIREINNFFQTGRIERLPPNLPFAKSVFVQVLEDLDIRYVVSEREADAITAAIANIIRGYVVTQDSDFFVFDIQGGVISALDFSQLTKQKSKCKVYRRSNLIDLLHAEDNCLSYLPVILGCDYSNQNLLKDIKHRVSLDIGRISPEHYLQILRNIFSLPEENLVNKVTEGKQQLLDEVNKILGEYDLKRIKETAEKYLKILKSSKEKCFDFTVFNRRDGSVNSSFIDYLTLMVNNGVVSGTVLDVYIYRIKLNGVQFEETCKLPSSSMASNLRKHIYSLLYKNTNEDVYITEYIRNKEVLEPFRVLAKSKDHITPDLYDQKDTLEYLYKVTNCTVHIPGELKEHSFFIIVTQFWINDCSVKTADFLEAFILCYASLQKNAAMVLNEKEINFSADLTYCGSCWQEIAMELSCLNDMLGRPVKCPQIHKTYDGKVLHYINKEIARGRSLHTKFGDQVMQLFKSLKEILHHFERR